MDDDAITINFGSVPLSPAAPVEPQFADVGEHMAFMSGGQEGLEEYRNKASEEMVRWNAFVQEHCTHREASHTERMRFFADGPEALIVAWTAEKDQIAQRQAEYEARMIAQMELAEQERAHQDKIERSAHGLVNGALHELIVLALLLEDVMRARYSLDRMKSELRPEHFSIDMLVLAYRGVLALDDAGGRVHELSLIGWMRREQPAFNDDMEAVLLRALQLVEDEGIPPKECHLPAARLIKRADARRTTQIEQTAADPKPQSDEQAATDDGRVAKVIAMIDHLALPNRASVRDCQAALRDAGQSTRQAVIQAAVRIRKSRS